MPTTHRFYFTGSSGGGAPLLTTGGWWTTSYAGLSHGLLTAPTGTGGNASNSSTAAPSARHRHISARGTTTRIGTLSGSLNMVIATRQNGATSDASLALRVRVMSADGATLRGVLFEGIDSVEFAIAGSHAAAATRRVSGALTPVAGVQVTDQLVVDIGTDIGAGSSGGGVYVYPGSSTLLADYADADGIAQGDGRPWLDFIWADPPMYLGSSPVSKAYLGSSPVDKAYLGSTRVL